MDRDINRLKVVLAEKKRTNKWLAEQLGVAPSTVSKWCTNVCQPSLETLLQIAVLQKVPESGGLLFFGGGDREVKIIISTNNLF